MVSTAISSAAIAKLREASKTLCSYTVMDEALKTCTAMQAEIEATPFYQHWDLADPEYVAAVIAAYVPKESFLRILREVCTMATQPGRQCAATESAECLISSFMMWMFNLYRRDLHHHYNIASECGYDLSWLMTDVPPGPTVLGLKVLCAQSSMDVGVENRMEYMLEGVFFRNDPDCFDSARVVEGAYHFFLAMFDLPGADRGLVRMVELGFHRLGFYMPGRIVHGKFADMCRDAATFLQEYPRYTDVYDDSLQTAEEKMHPDVAELFKVMRGCTIMISLKLGDSHKRRRGLCTDKAVEAGRLYVAAVKKKHYRRLWHKAAATRSICMYWQESSVKRACAEDGRARSEDLAALGNMCA